MRIAISNRSVRATALVATITGLAFVVGCARPVGSITGKVTYKDKNLKGGNVTFVSTEGQPSRTAEIGDDGTYTIPTITAGTYKITVETDSLRPKSLPPQAGGASGAPPGPGGKTGGPPPDAPIPPGYTPSNLAEASLVTANAKNAKKYVKIPDDYKDSNKTDLGYTVVGGAQTHNIELK